MLMGMHSRIRHLPQPNFKQGACCSGGLPFRAGVCTARTSRAKKSVQVQGMDDARITLIGHVRQVPEDQHKAATAEFLKANPQSFWVCSAPLSGSSSNCHHGLLSLPVPSALQVEFGDFVTFRMDKVLAVQYNGGFGRAPKVLDSPLAFASHSAVRRRSSPLCPSPCKLVDTAGTGVDVTDRLHSVLSRCPLLSVHKCWRPLCCVPSGHVRWAVRVALETDSTDTA